MALDTEFIKQTDRLIKQTLELYKNAGASPRIAEVWNIKNDVIFSKTMIFGGGLTLVRK